MNADFGHWDGWDADFGQWEDGMPILGIGWEVGLVGADLGTLEGKGGRAQKKRTNTTLDLSQNAP